MTTRNKNGCADALTAQAALEAIETFEIVGENNSSRAPNADDRFILTEYIAHAFDGYPVDQAAASATGTGAEGAVYQILTEEGAWLDVPKQIYDRTKSDPALTRVVYSAPQPAQADTIQCQAHSGPDCTECGGTGVWHSPAPARVGLTDALRRAREELSIVEWENDPPSRVVKLFDDIDALLAAHPGQPEPRSSITDDQRDKIERAEACLRNTGRKEDCQAANGLLDVLTEHPVQPEPRAADSPDDRRDGTRWRTLMKNGEPEVFVERTQRRAIQRTQTVAFSSPNLTGADRFDTPSEMWVKRYVMFAWWARENEHRKFIEAVDAIAAGKIQ
ncbi:TPA: hypothetical protein QDB48_000601 [Burkholderia vietnamiensis]|nr:hypothetical protein [Burkholderia vietnamiensis]